MATNSQIVDVGAIIGTLERQLGEGTLNLAPHAAHGDAEDALTAL